MTRRLLLVFAGLSGLAAVLALPRPARAGCLSSDGCEMAVGIDASVSPAMNCLQFGFDENDCVCRSNLTIRNDCDVPLAAADFQWCEKPYFEDCPTEIVAGASGALFLPRTEDEALGERTVQLPVTVGGEEHTLTVRYENVEIPPSGCAAAGSSGQGALVLALAALAGVALGRRRRRR